MRLSCWSISCKKKAAGGFVDKTAKAKIAFNAPKEVIASLHHFDLEKVASEDEFIEKMAQLELAYQKGEISEKEKEAGIALLRGAWGALKGGYSQAAKAMPGLKKTYQEAALHGTRRAGAAGASPLAQKFRGMTEGAKWVASELPSVVKQMGRGMSVGGRRAYQTAVRQVAKNSGQAAASTAGQKLLGAAVLGGTAGLGGGYMMGKSQQQPAGY
jgi:hypothetical protein